MTEYEQQSLAISQNNNGLFSDYYLNEIVPTLPDWNESLFNEGRQALEKIRALQASIQPEAQEAAHLGDEIKRRFDQEIPMSKRSEWRGFLAEQKAGHQQLTEQFMALETRMNAIVYDAFGLRPEERHLIEETTKYPYGEV